MPGTAANGIKAIVTNAGTFAVQATLAAETTKVIGTVNQGTSPWVVSGTVTARLNDGSGTSIVSGTYGTTPTGAASIPVNAFVTNTNANLATNADSVAAVAANAAGAGSPVNSAGYCWNGSTWDRCKANADPCSYAAKTNLPISFQTTSITQQIALSGSTKIYVCSLSLIASAATVFSITGGTGTNCGTPAALIGTTSATHGLSLAANGGMTLGNGAGTVAVTDAGSELCLVQSGSGDLVGNLTYVQQ
jgi:hypothetical protein